MRTVGTPGRERLSRAIKSSKTTLQQHQMPHVGLCLTCSLLWCKLLRVSATLCFCSMTQRRAQNRTAHFFSKLMKYFFPLQPGFARSICSVLTVILTPSSLVRVNKSRGQQTVTALLSDIHYGLDLWLQAVAYFVQVFIYTFIILILICFRFCGNRIHFWCLHKPFAF